MNHKLLVVVEDGMNSLTALVYAAKACACAESPEEGGIVILYVLPPLLSSINGMAASMVKKLAGRVQADRKRTATLVLEEMRQRAIQEGVRPEFVQIEVAENTGDTLQQILRTGKRHVCDTIVVGRNDGALLKQFFAGSLITRLLWKPIGFTIWIVENDSLPEFK
ncbi:MAG TPA: universal stress protein [Candidatus Binatia bacterium]|jgi:nucleotide-binding universal stress UspA family protein|nr:universal stress protein [Candidatus Binatia bacterium]